MPRIAEIDELRSALTLTIYPYNIAVETLRTGNRSQWEWGEPYPTAALQPSAETRTPA